MGEIFKYLMRNVTVKNKIAELRKEKGLSQKELAKILGYSVDVMFFIERGVALPTIKGAYLISKFFDKPIEEIFIFEENMPL